MKKRMHQSRRAFAPRPNVELLLALTVPQLDYHPQASTVGFHTSSATNETTCSSFVSTAVVRIICTSAGDSEGMLLGLPSGLEEGKLLGLSSGDVEGVCETGSLSWIQPIDSPYLSMRLTSTSVMVARDSSLLLKSLAETWKAMPSVYTRCVNHQQSKDRMSKAQ